MNLSESDINVVTEQGLRDLAEKGHRIEIQCKSDPIRKGPSWHGNWVMRTVNEDGMEKLLVTARTRTSRNDIKVREFKTATGVISFLIGLGFAQANIPLKAGQKTSNGLAKG